MLLYNVTAITYRHLVWIIGLVLSFLPFCIFYSFLSILHNGILQWDTD